MAINTCVKLILDSCITQRNWFLCLVEVLHASLLILLLLILKLFCKAQVNLDHLLLANWLLLDVEIIHDEEVLSTAWLEIDAVDLLVRGQAVMDDVSVVVLVVKDVLTGIDKHLELACDPYFKSNQEDVLLLVQDHADVLELQALEDSAFEWDTVQLVVCAGLIVVRPHISLLEHVDHLNLLLHELLVVVALSEDVCVLSQFNLHWLAVLLEFLVFVVIHYC